MNSLRFLNNYISKGMVWLNGFSRLSWNLIKKLHRNPFARFSSTMSFYFFSFIICKYLSLPFTGMVIWCHLEGFQGHSFTIWTAFTSLKFINQENVEAMLSKKSLKPNYEWEHETWSLEQTIFYHKDSIITKFPS